MARRLRWARPPRGNLPGVNAGTSEFIGIYSGVAPPKGCKIGVAPGVFATPAGHRSWAKRQPGFRNPRFRPVRVGVLSGILADLRLASGWSQTGYSRLVQRLPGTATVRANPAHEAVTKMCTLPV